MKVDMHNFQPLVVFNQHVKSEGELRFPTQDNDKATSLIHNQLNKALGITPQPTIDNYPHFDFSSVGENILGFVSAVIIDAKDNGATPETLQTMLDDAKKGIKEGLNEASQVLKELGLFNVDVENGINHVNVLLNDGLQVLSDKIFKDNDEPVVIGASRYHLTKGASFHINTKDGDELNIRFNAEYLQPSTLSVNSSSQPLPKNIYQNAFSVEINGKLNTGEQQAINDLLENLQNVSDLFFAGGFDEAFEKAQSISMDPTYLASFSMDLQRTETLPSVKQYQSVMPGKELAEQFSPVIEEMKQAYEHAKNFSIETHLSELLSWLIADRDTSADMLQYSQSIFIQLETFDPS